MAAGVSQQQRALHAPGRPSSNFANGGSYSVPASTLSLAVGGFGPEELRRRRTLGALTRSHSVPVAGVKEMGGLRDPFRPGLCPKGVGLGGRVWPQVAGTRPSCPFKKVVLAQREETAEREASWPGPRGAPGVRVSPGSPAAAEAPALGVGAASSAGRSRWGRARPCARSRPPRRGKGGAEPGRRRDGARTEVSPPLGVSCVRARELRGLGWSHAVGAAPSPPPTLT